LREYLPAPDGAENDEWWEIDAALPREEEPEEDLLEPVDLSDMTDLTSVAGTLYAMGYMTGPEMPMLDVLTRAVRWFQRSTRYYKDAGRRLAVDGKPGPLTRGGIKRRLVELGL
jgi:hypothetical protein